MTALLTASEAALLLDLPLSDIGLARRSGALACVADHDCEHSAGNGHRYTRESVEALRPRWTGDAPAAGDDTRSRSHAYGAAGDRTARNALPRAAGAAPTRGAQPLPPQAVRCANCRKRIRRYRDGSWYHDHNASESCYFGTESSKRAEPMAGVTRHG